MEPAALLAGGREHLAERAPESQRAVADREHRRGHAAPGGVAQQARISPSPVWPRLSRESFQAGKGLAGLDEHQVRRWLPWRRATVLAMLAHALLAAITTVERAGHPAPTGLIALTCDEVCRLLPTVVHRPTPQITDPQSCSRRRRRHQHRARTSHYQRRTTSTTRSSLDLRL